MYTLIYNYPNQIADFIMRIIQLTHCNQLVPLTILLYAQCDYSHLEIDVSMVLTDSLTYLMLGLIYWEGYK